MSTYVCSDIHGNYELWLKMLKKIKFTDNDHMYIIGDVIDRGAKPITLLKDIMNRDNCTLLLGNHEWMMLNSLTNQDCNIDSYNEYNLWLQNGAQTTIDEIEELTVKELKDIICYLQNSPVLIIGLQIPRTIKIGDKKIIKDTNYYLAHASWSQMYIPKGIYTTAEVPDLDTILWNRQIYKNESIAEFLRECYKDYIFIGGHTPTPNLRRYQLTFKGHCKNNNLPANRGRIFHMNKHFINIDCGCYGNNATLGCLRLDDWREFYVM